MSVLYLLIVWFSSWEFSWPVFIVLLIVDGVIWSNRKRALEEKITAGDADEDEIDEYLDQYDGDEDIVQRHRNHK